MEGKIERGLEARMAVGCLAVEAPFGLEIKEQRPFGHQAARGDGDDLAEDPEVHAATVALVGHRRIGVPRADDHATLGQGGTNHLGHVLGARGIEEQCIGDRVDRLAAVGHEQFVQPVAERGAARLARQEHVVPALDQRGRQPARLQRLAGAVGALDRDEMAGRPAQ